MYVIQHAFLNAGMRLFSNNPCVNQPNGMQPIFYFILILKKRAEIQNQNYMKDFAQNTLHDPNLTSTMWIIIVNPG